MSFLTGTNTELVYANTNAGTAKTTFTTEATPILNDITGMGVQAHIPPDFWLPNQTSVGRGLHIKAQGLFSTTATPTYTFSIRLGAVNNLTTAQVLATAALTTGSGVTNQPWLLEGDVVLTAITGAATSTARGQGWFWSPGIASPFMAGAGASGSLTAPTVSTIDTSITNFVNVNVACSASSASNSVTLQQLMVWGLN
jgi:hypothetical protein